MKCLVTGGAGFLGSHVVDALISQGHEVTIMDDMSGGFESNVPRGVKLYTASIADSVDVNLLFACRKFDYVYHLAAYAAEGLSHYVRNFNYTNNLIGSINLINASIRHNVKCFVFTSSIAVYGAGQLPMTEDMVPRPEDPYGIAKYSVELDLAAAYVHFGLPYIIFRPHNVYGERQNIGDPYRNVIGIFMNQILKKEPLTIFGDGEQTRAFTHIADVAPVIADSVNYPEVYQRIFNIGADAPYTINVLIEYIQRIMCYHVKRNFQPERNEVRHAYSSHAKARKLLGYSPKVDLDEGLRRMAAWVEQHGSRASKPFENIEITKNLPPSWEPIHERS